MNITPLDADQFTRGCVTFFLYSLACNLYSVCLRFKLLLMNSIIGGGSLHYLLCCLSLLLIIEMFSIRLSEAKENRILFYFILSLHSTSGLQSAFYTDRLIYLIFVTLACTWLTFQGADSFRTRKNCNAASTCEQMGESRLGLSYPIHRLWNLR